MMTVIVDLLTCFVYWLEVFYLLFIVRSILTKTEWLAHNRVRAKVGKQNKIFTNGKLALPMTA